MARDHKGSTDRIALPGASSVAASHGAIAVAADTAIRQDPGTVSFDDASAMIFVTPRHAVTVGALPDMLTPDSAKALVANDREPNDSYTIDHRPDHKGPEPEAMAIGRLNNRTLALICSDRGRWGIVAVRRGLPLENRRP